MTDQDRQTKSTCPKCFRDNTVGVRQKPIFPRPGRLPVWLWHCNDCKHKWTVTGTRQN